MPDITFLLDGEAWGEDNKSPLSLCLNRDSMNIFLHHQTAGSVRRITLTASLALLCFSGNASAESNEVQELRLEVEML
ncbi:MAG: hypothetical protein WAW41_06890, partial [Methylobacter sp.]